MVECPEDVSDSEESALYNSDEEPIVEYDISDPTWLPDENEDYEENPVMSETVKGTEFNTKW